METKARIYLSPKRGGSSLAPEDLIILKSINETKSLTRTAEKLGLSYKHVWNVIKKSEKVVGKKLVKTKHGGAGGGGGVYLTEAGTDIVRKYTTLSGAVQKATTDEGFWEALGLKLSIRNKLKGRIVDISSDKVSSKVVIMLDAPEKITALVTKEAVDDLGLKVGDSVFALIKSTEVAIAKPEG